MARKEYCWVASGGGGTSKRATSSKRDSSGSTYIQVDEGEERISQHEWRLCWGRADTALINAALLVLPWPGSWTCCEKEVQARSTQLLASLAKDSVVPKSSPIP
jgi:hypothetical protein